MNRKKSVSKVEIDLNFIVRYRVESNVAAMIMTRSNGMEVLGIPTQISIWSYGTRERYHLFFALNVSLILWRWPPSLVLKPVHHLSQNDSAVDWLLCDVRCAPAADCRVLNHVCWLLFAECWVLTSVCWMLFADCCALTAKRCWPAAATVKENSREVAAENAWKEPAQLATTAWLSASAELWTTAQLNKTTFRITFTATFTLYQYFEDCSF